MENTFGNTVLRSTMKIRPIYLQEVPCAMAYGTLEKSISTDFVENCIMVVFNDDKHFGGVRSTIQ